MAGYYDEYLQHAEQLQISMQNAACDESLEDKRRELMRLLEANPGAMRIIQLMKDLGTL